MILQDLWCEHQGLLNPSDVPVDLGHVISGHCGVVEELWQFLLPSVDRGSKSQNAGEMVHCSGPLATQLGVLLDEVSNCCLQRHSFHVLTFIVHLLVVASPCMSQMDHLALPLIEGCVEHLLGSFRLPGRAHVEVVELTVNQSP